MLYIGTTVHLKTKRNENGLRVFEGQAELLQFGQGLVQFLPKDQGSLFSEGDLKGGVVAMGVPITDIEAIYFRLPQQPEIKPKST